MGPEGRSTPVDEAWGDLQTARSTGDEDGVRAATARLRELDDLRVTVDRRAPLTGWHRMLTHRWVSPVLVGLLAALGTVVVAEVAAGIPGAVLLTALGVGVVVAWVVALASPGAPQDTDAMLRAAGSWFQGDG